jgi:hypothetical protein
VLDRVERDDRAEAARRELHARHVAVEERRAGNVPPRELDLAAREVDPRDAMPLGDPRRDRDARAAAGVEHVRPLRQQREQLVEPPEARPRRRLGLERGVVLGDLVVAALDDPARVVLH